MTRYRNLKIKNRIFDTFLGLIGLCKGLKSPAWIATSSDSNPKGPETVFFLQLKKDNEEGGGSRRSEW